MPRRASSTAISTSSRPTSVRKNSAASSFPWGRRRLLPILMKSPMSAAGWIEVYAEAAEQTVLDIQFMAPSCVPATSFDHSGAVIGAEELARALQDSYILGAGGIYELSRRRGSPGRRAG